MKFGIPAPAIDFAPKTYFCRRAKEALVLDGNLEKPFWRHAPWTEDFQDIEGEAKPKPRYRTRAKLLWDDEALYIGAELWGDEIWAHVTERDEVVFSDNDFEIFIDPDSDTHCYCEFEMNALGTMWDLLLTKPYRDGGMPIDSFDIKGLRCAVKIDGTLGKPGPHNLKWSAEIVMPLRSLLECTGQSRTAPVAGDFWRLNFSRVQWLVDKEGEQYRKRIDPTTQRAYPEDNWVWSPMGVVNMHYPELWGFVFFCTGADDTYAIPEDERRKWTLRQYYYEQKAQWDAHGRYTPEVRAEGLSTQVLADWFIAACPAQDGGTLRIGADGKITRVGGNER